MGFNNGTASREGTINRSGSGPIACVEGASHSHIAREHNVIGAQSAMIEGRTIWAPPNVTLGADTSDGKLHQKCKV